MKIMNLAAIVTLVVSLAAHPARAQVSTFQVLIPFPFVVGSQTLPAGTYTVQRLLGKLKSADTPGVIVMKAGDRHVYKVIVTGPSETHHAASPQGSKLFFTSFKGKQYLNRVWVAGDSVAHQLANVPPDITAQGATGEVIVAGLHSKGK